MRKKAVRVEGVGFFVAMQMTVEQLQSLLVQIKVRLPLR